MHIFNRPEKELEILVESFARALAGTIIGSSLLLVIQLNAHHFDPEYGFKETV